MDNRTEVPHPTLRVGMSWRGYALDPKKVADRLWEIELMGRSDFPDEQKYVEAIKQAILELRQEVERV